LIAIKIVIALESIKNQKNIVTMKTFKIISTFMLLLLILSCEKDEVLSNPSMNPGENPEGATEFTLGWSGEDDLSKVPVTTNFSFGNGNLPSSYDMSDKFPPVGDQGQFGTCVAWAVGYNTKTALSGIQKNLSPSELAAPNNQFSPKDLFLSINDQNKSANCQGTNFSFALDVLQQRGIATQASVPYVNLGDCSNAKVDPSWTQEAENFKIKYWRKVPGEVNAIKENVANNVPVILGAKLADNFMTWGSDDVLTSHSSFTQVGIHAYHALVITGYDDSKGPNGAFRAVNSWSENWGDFGFVWIDYNFLINEFGVNWNGENSLYIMANQDGEIAPPNDDNQPNNQSSGVDLAPWVFSDFSTSDYSGYLNSREIEFNVYNIGNQTAQSSDDWSLYYIYFNAFDANDYGVLFYDQFNTSIAQNSFECPTENNCIVNLDIPGQSDFASFGFGTETVTRSYSVPDITGEYYLVMITDGDNIYNEQDEQNNFFYPTVDPVYFENGFAFRGEEGTSSFNFNNTTESTRSNSVINMNFSTTQKGSFKNGYTNEEIKAFLRKEKKSGRLDQKLTTFGKTSDSEIMYKTSK